VPSISTEIDMEEPVVLSFELAAHPAAEIPDCPSCEVQLDLHQPHDGRPWDLLGYCEGCDRWFRVVRPEEGDGPTVACELPGPAVIRERLKLA
jgi:hypothetical protein